ncbi:MAG: DUF2974 domain-containing protein [Moorea sp. SIO3C2]|nr:DUF2974 domain-containing protein [Moorena sp. SIO3C2]
MKIKASDKDFALAHPTWPYLADVASFCAYIYESKHKDPENPIADYSEAKGIGSDLYASIRNNWTRVDPENFSKPSLPKCRKIIGGLVLDVWHRRVSETEPELFILFFRGSDKEINDWWTNFRWITRFVPRTWDQYSQVIEYTSHVVAQILKLSPKATIISAGHSLGGGLATAASYCSPHIETVYAFNSSPVTGYFSVDRQTRKRSREDLIIFRVYEKGEILAYARGVMQVIWPLSKKDPKVIRIECDFTAGNFVQKHSMTALAQSLQVQEVQVEQDDKAT